MGGLHALNAYRQFIIWQRVPLADGSVDKIPISHLNGRTASAHDGSVWTDWGSAALRARQLGPEYGVGFVLTKKDPFWFIDLDNVADGTGWKPIVDEVYRHVTGAAVGLSQSGRGLHLIGSGRVTTERRIRPVKDPANTGFDGLYTDGRFVALSGHQFTGDAATDCTAGLAAVVGRWLPPTGAMRAAEWTSEPSADWSGPLDDSELLKMAMASRSGASVFGNAVTFAQLWEADADALGRRWPCEHGVRPWDFSEADMSLAQHLAFWTGKDCARIDRLMRQSKLYRDKYERDDYLYRTILRAAGMQEKVLNVAQCTVDETQTNTDPNYRTENPFMPVPDQVQYFKNCVYVTAVHRVLTPTGVLLKPDQFKAHYGGPQFSLGIHQDSKTTRSAFDAFTLNQGYRFPRADDMAFEPLRPPREIVERNGRRYVNSFVPLFGERRAGDVAIFIQHTERLLPDPGDREILLSYMAACVQRVGVKFQWCPVVQGVEGNGKTIFYEVLEYALGVEYCHLIDPNDIGSVFNAWIENKLLCTIEEIWTGGRYETAERLKPLITNKRVPLQGKGADQRTARNLANFLLFSNHPDAVLKTANDRRYAVLYTAQQSMSHLHRDGMDRAYFSKIYDWLGGDGHAAVAEYLATRPITIDPLDRAPNTTSTEAAIRQSLGVAEQLLVEAIEDCIPGFTPDMIDGTQARFHLQANGKTLSPRAIVESLGRLGYVKHPILKNGRIMVDSQRLILYVRQGSVAADISDCAVLAQHWRDASVLSPA